MSRNSVCLVLLVSGLFFAAGLAPVDDSPATGDRAASPKRAAIERVVADYVGLYAGRTLERWKALFDPALSVASPQDDGTIKVRNIAEFYGRQKDYFATGRRISERLENVRIDEGRRIARVSADFVFVDEGEESRGKLGLHLAEGNDGWKVVAIVFSYDAE